jgi:heterodisulfide reductase subunit C
MNEFSKEIKEISGENFNLCYQCKKCTAGCPTAEFMEIKPNEIIRHIQYGNKDILLKSEAIWLCVACETCGERCPNDIKISKLAAALRRKAIEEQVEIADKIGYSFNTSFVESIKKYGRVHEATFLISYKLKTKDFFSEAALNDMKTGIKLFMRGKLPLFPKKIKDLKTIKKIFEKNAPEI